MEHESKYAGLVRNIIFIVMLNVAIYYNLFGIGDGFNWLAKAFWLFVIGGLFTIAGK